MTADSRRRGPQSPTGEPRISWQPGLAQDTLRELAPLLAEEGIDVDNIDVPDLATLQAAMNRAVERLNMTRFTPVGRARELAVSALHRAVEALTAGDGPAAAAILAEVVPDSPDETVATAAGCIGVSLGLLDEWLTVTVTDAPAVFARRVDLPAGHWAGERAATDILALARKGRSFRTLDRLLVSHGGKNVLDGAVLALSAAVRTWAADTNATVSDILLHHVR